MIRVRNLALWVLLLFSLKAAAALWETSRDSRLLAQGLDDLGVAAEEQILGVDLKANGLPLYGYENFEWVRQFTLPYPYFRPPDDLISALLAANGAELFLLTPSSNHGQLRDLLESTFQPCTTFGRVLDIVVIRCEGDPADSGELTVAVRTDQFPS